MKGEMSFIEVMRDKVGYIQRRNVFHRGGEKQRGLHSSHLSFIKL